MDHFRPVPSGLRVTRRPKEGRHPRQLWLVLLAMLVMAWCPSVSAGSEGAAAAAAVAAAAPFDAGSSPPSSHDLLDEGFTPYNYDDGFAPYYHDDTSSRGDTVTDDPVSGCAAHVSCSMCVGLIPSQSSCRWCESTQICYDVNDISYGSSWRQGTGDDEQNDGADDGGVGDDKLTCGTGWTDTCADKYYFYLFSTVAGALACFCCGTCILRLCVAQCIPEQFNDDDAEAGDVTAAEELQQRAGVLADMQRELEADEVEGMDWICPLCQNDNLEPAPPGSAVWRAKRKREATLAANHAGGGGGGGGWSSTFHVRRAARRSWRWWFGGGAYGSGDCAAGEDDDSTPVGGLYGGYELLDDADAPEERTPRSSFSLGNSLNGDVEDGGAGVHTSGVRASGSGKKGRAHGGGGGGGGGSSVVGCVLCGWEVTTHQLARMSAPVRAVDETKGDDATGHAQRSGAGGSAAGAASPRLCCVGRGKRLGRKRRSEIRAGRGGGRDRPRAWRERG